ncbi:MAG: apolipoprotein N-acyltransferase, partial [Mariprofundaceae bacterium]|nr:apolipoprotein N-acyltransferase [Mariprofundaceae bacterium]
MFSSWLMRVFAGFLCGVAMPFAFAPYHWLGLGIISLVGLCLLIQQTHPVRTAYAFGMGWFGVGAWWLAPTVHQYGGLSWWLASLVVVLMGLILACFPALWIWICRKLAAWSQLPYALLILLPSTIIIMEYLRGHLFTGLPWTALGNLLLDTPAVGWLSVWGVYGGALLPVWLAVSLAFLWQKHQRRYACISLVSLFAVIALTPSINMPTSDIKKVALIQPNIPQDERWNSDVLANTLNTLTQLSADAAAQVDLIVWPEAAVPFYLSRLPSWHAWLTQQMQPWQTPVLFGGLKYFPKQDISQNGLYLFEGNDMPEAFVGKHHLVPFGEYVPSWLPWMRKIGVDIGDFSPARDVGVLHDAHTYYGSLICYESLFPEEARERVQQGAEVLIVVTNDAWYGKSPAAWQHFQASRVRAVEEGRYVLRAANTGITAIIAPDGHVTKSTDWWQTMTLIGDYQLVKVKTLYQQWGDMIAILCASLGMI